MGIPITVGWAFHALARSALRIFPQSAANEPVTRRAGCFPAAPKLESELEPGDVVCFPVGPEGAHKLTNRTDAIARVLIFSTKVDPSMAVYPDSDKIGIWSGQETDKRLLVRRESDVDYWDRES